jgi:hypothetical protein
MLRTIRMGLVLAGAVGLSACGSGPTDPPPPPPPSPVPVVTTSVIYGDNGGVPADSAIYVDFGIPSAGTVDATVDWTFPSSDVWIALTTTACDDFIQAFIGSCSHIAPVNRGNNKPKTVSGAVTQGGPGRLWIANFATVDESMALQITLTTTRAAGAASPVERFSGTIVRVPGSASRSVRALEKE